MELGVRSFVFSSLYDYKFTIKNKSDKHVIINGLVYNSLNDVNFSQLIVSDKYDNYDIKKQAVDDFILKPNEPKVFDYFVESPEQFKKGTRFLYLKPFLKYHYEDEERLFPLDFTVFSDVFTDEDVNNIIQYNKT